MKTWIRGGRESRQSMRRYSQPYRKSASVPQLIISVPSRLLRHLVVARHWHSTLLVPEELTTELTPEQISLIHSHWEHDGGQVIYECRINLHASKLSELAGMTRYEDLLSGSYGATP